MPPPQVDRGPLRPLPVECSTIDLIDRAITAPTRSTGNQPPAKRPDPVIINGREYEPMVKITPPGGLRSTPALLQQPFVTRLASPPPPYQSTSGGFDPDESDHDSEEEGAIIPKSERSLAPDVMVPQFWGVVCVSNFNGVPGQEGLERDNAMRNMLSHDSYLSRSTNMVYVGDLAWEAFDYERRNTTAYMPYGPEDTLNNQVYVKSPRGLPLNPDQVKKLRTLYKDHKRFSNRHQVEAYLLLKELFTIAHRVIPQHRDRSMIFLLEPNGFYETPPAFFPSNVLRGLQPLPRNAPPRQEQPPAGESLMNLNAVGLYLLNYHRPGSTNPSVGMAMDFAFQVGRRSIFGYSLSRLLGPTNMHAFQRQFILLVATPRRYREAIVVYNRANPLSPFVPQGGPTYTLHRSRLDQSRAANLSTQDITSVLLDNRIPPEWVDHAYPYGVIGLNSFYTGSPAVQGVLDPFDNERLAHLHIYGEPPAIAG